MLEHLVNINLLECNRRLQLHVNVVLQPVQELTLIVNGGVIS